MHSLPPVALGVFFRPRNRGGSKNLNREGSHEHQRAIYPAAGGHHPADDGGGVGRRHCIQPIPVAPLPQVDFPTISVNASLPGASAQIMASSVATPLERQFGHIAGITEMTSSSQLGQTDVTMQFDLSRNIDGAARDVEAAINAARTYLPANLPGNPTYRQVNPADAPIMILGLTSKKYDKEAMYDAASTILEQKLSQIQGVGQVTVGGASYPAVRVDVSPTQLNSYGLTMANVQSMLSLQNSQLARGQISNGFTTADIVDNGQILNAALYKP